MKTILSLAALACFVSTLSSCSDDAKPADTATPDGGSASSSSGGSSSGASSSSNTSSTSSTSSSGSTSSGGTAPASGKARCKLTISNIAGSNVKPDPFESDEKAGSANPEPASGGAIINCGTKGVNARGFALTLGGPLTAGAVFDMKAGLPGNNAGFEEVHQLGVQTARWTTTEVTPPAGKATVLTMTGKSLTFKFEGLAMAPNKIVNGDGSGTFTIDGTGEATLP